MDALIIIINILLILTAIVLIVAVLMQEGNRAGLGAIGGGAETFFGKSKAKSVQGKLQLITKIAAVVFIVLAIACTALVAWQEKAIEAEQAALLEQQAAEEAALAAEEAQNEIEIVPETEATDAPVAEPSAAPEATAEPAAEPSAAPEATAVPAAEPSAAPEATDAPAA